MSNILSKKSIKPLSYRQKQAIENWMQGRRKNKAEALRLAGYCKSVVRQPHKVFNSPAVQLELSMRGHGVFGITNNEVPQKPPIVTKQKEVYDIDFSIFKKEDWQDLKEKLAQIP